MTPRRTIKVRIPVTVEVDVDAWADSYGCEATAADVRKDVQGYFENEIAMSPAVIGGDLVVRVSV